MRDRVVRRIYADMRSIDWDELSARDRSRQYDLWNNDSEIGAIIANFKDDPRHWIKDGPVKEWPRAKIGHGPYARLLGGSHDPAAERQQLAEKIVRLTLPGWIPDPDSITEKPMRMVVHPPFHGEEVDARIIAWASSENFKHLLWAALEAVESDDHRSWVLAVTETFEKPVAADTKALHRRIVQRCQLQVEHIEL
ncbi:hypothetical protein EIL87_10280 [Saccharopolyspora rhizosphaerae]|uniref:Uncharacterized protein n=1 Tax=Saccharopolyspora rhizosphaerae TaxID=2492662 RepID=A0A3R8VHN1_9PSEU|nr:hypothetical protein [Saccharopolyspora rhizosphaerae]RRO17649.1 hypothetical protein EIL87_10280 [Saccharopolyspora rhizosphaerae]